jgi:hypothetical protein
MLKVVKKPFYIFPFGGSIRKKMSISKHTLNDISYIFDKKVSDSYTSKRNIGTKVVKTNIQIWKKNIPT